MMPLSKPELQIVYRLLIETDIPVNHLIDNQLSTRSLTVENVDLLEQIVLDEMYKKGLEKDDEPNNYGRVLDDIVGKIGYYGVNHE